MTATLSADPWTMLGIGVLAVVVWVGLVAVVWSLIYAHGEREATHIPVEADR